MKIIRINMRLINLLPLFIKVKCFAIIWNRICKNMCSVKIGISEQSVLWQLCVEQHTLDLYRARCIIIDMQ